MQISPIKANRHMHTNTFFMHHSSRRIAALLVLLSYLLSLTAASAGSSLPGVSMVRSDRILRVSLTKKFTPGQRSSMPGGIAFTGTASPKEGWQVVEAGYNKKAEDGKRLYLEMRNGTDQRNVSVPAFDWELIPIVDFVSDEDENDSLVTMSHQIGLVMFFQYHRSIADEHVGVRLWQADFNLINLENTLTDAARIDLPTDSQTNDYLLASGELPPNVASNRQKLNDLRKDLLLLKTKEHDSEYESYTICDYEIQVVFEPEVTDKEHNVLKFQGKPLWLFWRSIPNSNDDSVILLEEYSIDATRIIERHELGNPTVYRSLTKTMQISAILRHLKEGHPRIWNDLREQVGIITVTHAAEPPDRIQIHATVDRQ
jgi:hypothetical protein